MFKKDIKIVGIAGKIASGKSFAGKLLREKGYEVIDVDKVAHEVLTIPFVKDRVRNLFGDSVFDSNGEISRKILGDLVFSDQTMLFTLNQLVFGIVYIKTVEKLLSLNSDIVFIESALLFSMGLDHICDAVVYVFALPEIRLKRIMENRGLDKDRAVKRLLAQDDQPTAQYQRLLRVITNNKTEDDFKDEIDVAVENILSILGKRYHGKVS